MKANQVFGKTATIEERVKAMCEAKRKSKERKKETIFFTASDEYFSTKNKSAEKGNQEKHKVSKLEQERNVAKSLWLENV